MLAETLQLCFEGGVMHIYEGAPRLLEEDLVDVVSRTLLKLWK